MEFLSYSYTASWQIDKDQYRSVDAVLTGERQSRFSTELLPICQEFKSQHFPWCLQDFRKFPGSHNLPKSCLPSATSGHPGICGSFVSEQAAGWSPCIVWTWLSHYRWKEKSKTRSVQSKQVLFSLASRGRHPAPCPLWSLSPLKKPIPLSPCVDYRFS